MAARGATTAGAGIALRAARRINQKALELKRQASNSDLRERSCSAAPLEGCGSASGPAHDFAVTLLRTNNRSCHSSLELDSVFLGL